MYSGVSNSYTVPIVFLVMKKYAKFRVAGEYLFQKAGDAWRALESVEHYGDPLVLAQVGDSPPLLEN